MNVTVNDQVQHYPTRLTIAELLVQLGLSDRPVAVEVNGELVSKPEHGQTWLQDGDQLEVVSLTGGG